MRAFATYAVAKVTRTRLGNGWRQNIERSTLLDEDDELAALLRRARDLPGRHVTIRVADGAQMAHRLTAPGEVSRLPEETTDAGEREDVEDIRVAG